ncbi:MAG: CPBP family intramembrane glutamic endopeptidase [Bacteroidota bacterium]
MDLWLPGALADTPLATWAFLPAAAGPALGVLAARRIDRRTVRRTTILGADARLSTLTAVVPLVAFATIGGIGVLLPAVALIYALGEEIGWRGYLTDALGAYAPGVRYTLVALAWWPWHLRFATQFDWLVFPWIVLASSWVLGHAARESRSVLVAAAMHATVMLLTMGGTPSRSLVLAGSIALAGWILLGWLFPNRPAEEDGT